MQTSRNVDEHNPARALVRKPGFVFGILLLIHALLALGMRNSSQLSTAHAVLTIMIGCGLALFSKDIRTAGFVAAYIAGAEVLWRMTGTNIFWETGKYATVLVLGLALFRMRSWKSFWLPIWYFAFLIPSILLTISYLGITESARSEISFNLSGPLALAVCILYFTQVHLGQRNLISILGTLILPIAGVLTLSVSSTITAERIFFTDNSNFFTSGGFGPNQVSAVLGLAGALLILISIETRGFSSLIALILAGFFLVQSTLTFSRGGIVNAIVMLVLAGIHFLRIPERKWRFGLVLGVIVLASIYLIAPQLQNFTGGAFSQRYSSADLTGRNVIVQQEIQLWMENPWLGVGPGIAKYLTSERYGSALTAAHTEYTRLLAEHGVAGLIAFILLLIIIGRAYFQAPGLYWRGWVAALAGWSLTEMSHAAMRIVMISFLLGLAVTFSNEKLSKEKSVIKSTKQMDKL